LFFSSALLRKGRGMTTGRTLHLAALLVAAAVLAACAAAVLAVSQKAEAAFPGKDGKIAYRDGGVLYTINPDGGGKTEVANHLAGGYSLDYSPTGKKVTYLHD
jgi:predicted lipoprotein with Yx(FWY)xxD motif